MRQQPKMWFASWCERCYIMLLSRQRNRRFCDTCIKWRVRNKDLAATRARFRAYQRKYRARRPWYFSPWGVRRRLESAIRRAIDPTFIATGGRPAKSVECREREGLQQLLNDYKNMPEAVAWIKANANRIKLPNVRDRALDAALIGGNSFDETRSINDDAF